jgi:hypothetical protein
MVEWDMIILFYLFFNMFFSVFYRVVLQKMQRIHNFVKSVNALYAGGAVCRKGFAIK